MSRAPVLLRQQPLQLAVAPLAAGDQAGGAGGQPLRGPHVGDALAERILDRRDRRGLVRGRTSPCSSAFSSSSGIRPKSTSPWLSDFSGLPPKSSGAEVQNASTGSVSSNTSMPRARGRFQLGIRFQPLDAVAGEVIDLGLVGLEVLDILLQRAFFARRRGEARQRQQFLAPLVILPDAFLDDRAERVPDFGDTLPAPFRRGFPVQQITRPVTALRICASCGLFCSISREMLSGRSSLSITPRMKRR